MKKHTLAKSIACTLALVASGTTMAETQFYGAISYGNSVTSGDNAIPYTGFDETNTGNLEVLTVPYGNSIYSDVKLGVRFNNMFVELAGGQTRFDGAAGDGNGGTNDCTIEPTAGLITDCFDDATIDFDSKIKNLDLVFGWTFAPSETWSVQPYVGLRRVDLKDNRNVDYLYFGGVSDTITDNTNFKKTGFLVGLRTEKDFGEVFFSTDFNYSHASGTRTRFVTDTEYTTPGGVTTDFESDTFVDDISLRQWNLRLAVGHRFKVSENNNMSLSIGYKIGRVDGFDTTNTNPDSYPVGSLGSNNASLSSRGFDVMLGWNF